jgi:hypothetical protein
VRPAVGVALIAALALLLVVAQLNPFLGDFGDDAEFLILGQGLARGEGYAWVNTPERPAHNRYPPGYPVLLAAALRASGTAGDAYRAIVPAKVATAATLLLTVPLLWHVARRRLPAWWAVGAVALFALDPVAIRFGAQVMSDVPYVPVLLAAIAWAEAHVRSRRILDWVVLGALLAAGAYVRSIGLPSAAGVLRWARLRPERRGGAIAATLSFFACMAPWWARDAALAGGWRYLEELTSATYLDPDAGTVSAGGLLARALDNAAFVAGKPAQLGPLGILAALLGTGLLVVGARRSWLVAGGASEVVTTALCAAVLLWPIKTARYLLPVIPLFGVYELLGLPEVAHAIAERGVAGRRALALAATGGTIAVCAALLGLSVRDAASNVTRLQRGAAPSAYYADRPEWARYLDAAGWLSENASPSDVAMSRRHFALYVYSGHYADKYRFDTSPEELAYLTAGGARKYVVEDAFDFLRGDFAPLPAALRSRGGDLILRYETDSPRVRVWELVRPR